MKKLFTTSFAALVTGLMSLSLHADYQYLYWTVDETHDTDQYQFSYATVKAGDSSYLSLYSPDSSSAYGTKLYNSSTPGDGLVTDAGYAGLGEGIDYSGSTFLFELWMENASGGDALVAWKSVGYSALAGNVFANTQSGSGSTPYVVSNLVPEPTSGMLFLLGIAGLALRRRRGYKEVNL